jgi:hypothetical protein
MGSITDGNEGQRSSLTAGNLGVGYSSLNTSSFVLLPANARSGFVKSATAENSLRVVRVR